MASTAPISLSSSSSTTTSLVDSKPTCRQPTNVSPQAVTLPMLASPLQSQSQRGAAKTAAHCKRLARNVVAMATGEAKADVSVAELPELVKTMQEAWEKVEDKYAVSSLAVAGVVFLWGSTGMLSAIDRLPLIPGILELVGIGYTGWFAYKNLVFKPDREALLRKIRCTYEDIIGTSTG